MNFWQILALLGQGIAYTVMVTLACSATGLVLGLGIAMLRQLNFTGVNRLLSLLVYILRAIPVLVLLFIVFFGLPNIGLQVPPLVSMMLSLGVIAGAYLAEVFRGALASIDPNEIMAAEAMGLSRWQILKDIELPQMLRFSVPGMINDFTTVLK